MKKITFLSLLVLITLLATDCVTIDTASAKDPEYSQTRFSRLLIISTYPDLIFKDKIEKTIKDRFGLYFSIPRTTGNELMPPIRMYADDEIAIILSKNKINALLIIAEKKYWETQIYVAPSSITLGSVGLVGKAINYSQATISSEGGTRTSPNYEFESRLIDYATGKVVWKAQTIISGNSSTSFSAIARSLTNSILKKMYRDKLFAFMHLF
jgi:hypothetical protein